MARQSRHIVKYGYNAFAFKSISAAAEAVKFFGKLEKVKSEIGPETRDYLFFTPDPDTDHWKIELLTDQRYVPAKPPKEEKPLGLPAPKRGTILCICEKSYVAPRQTCPHCGRTFSESHNRTHGTAGDQPNLRLV